jgi:hypothetical protein
MTSPVSYAPRSQLTAWLRKGWRLVTDHEYNPGDWAIVMRYAPDTLMSEDEIFALAERFKRPFIPITIRSNLSRAASGRNISHDRRMGRVYDKVLRRLVPA